MIWEVVVKAKEGAESQAARQVRWGSISR